MKIKGKQTNWIEIIPRQKVKNKKLKQPIFKRTAKNNKQINKKTKLSKTKLPILLKPVPITNDNELSKTMNKFEKRKIEKVNNKKYWEQSMWKWKSENKSNRSWNFN